MKSHEIPSAESVGKWFAHLKRTDKADLAILDEVNGQGSRRFWKAMGIGVGVTGIGAAGLLLALNLTTPTQVPQGGYRNSVVASATPIPRITSEASASSTPTPEPTISAGDYIHIAFESLLRVSPDGKSITDYLSEAGYKIFTKNKGFILLEMAEFGELPKGSSLDVLRTPVPEQDPNFQQNIATKFEEQGKFPIYAIFPVYDPQRKIFTFFGLTNYLENPKSPGWVIIGGVDSDGPFWKADLRKEFRQGLLDVLNPYLNNDIPKVAGAKA